MASAGVQLPVAFALLRTKVRGPAAHALQGAGVLDCSAQVPTQQAPKTMCVLACTQVCLQRGDAQGAGEAMRRLPACRDYSLSVLEVRMVTCVKAGVMVNSI